jgi:uncharacterized linocin/CFP29 family protein
VTNVLRRHLAPLSEEAWQLIDDEVRNAMSALLSARRVVDFRGPHGYRHSCVSLGRLEHVERDEGLSFGVRSVLPLTEVRVDFSLSLEELDNVNRGALEIDLESAREAAVRLVAFEERFVYGGFEPAHVEGILTQTPHEPVALGPDPGSYVAAVTQARQVLVAAGVSGPYALVLAPDVHMRLESDVSSYPPAQRVAKLIEGPLLESQQIEGGLLISMRGGDFQLDVGQDVSVGYSMHTTERVDLFLLETMTFRVLEAEAAVKLV